MSYYNPYVNPFAHYANNGLVQSVQVITPVISVPSISVSSVSQHRYSGCTHNPPCESSYIHVPKGSDEGNYIVLEHYVGHQVIHRLNGCTITPIRQEARINLRREGVPMRIKINGIIYTLKTSASLNYYGVKPQNVTLDTSYQNNIPI